MGLKSINRLRNCSSWSVWFSSQVTKDASRWLVVASYQLRVIETKLALQNQKRSEII